MIHQESLNVPTQGHGDMQDLTEPISQIICKSGIHTGMVNVFNIGSTAAIGAIEFEPGLTHDLPELLNRLIPPSRDYKHEQTWHDENGHSHLQGTWLGTSLTIPIQKGQLVLGTWQQIFHLECDIKPRQRQVMVTIDGE
jgi:secondary thiamine-phosphate synthase enzyme